MFRDFRIGAGYVFSGIRDFYRDGGAWRYALMPFVIMLPVYALVFWLALHLAGDAAAFLQEFFGQLPRWLAWIGGLLGALIRLLGFLVGCLVLGSSMSFFYQATGGLFFDALTGYYERRQFGIAPRRAGFAANGKYAWDSLCFGLAAAGVFLLLLLIGILLPVAGQVLTGAVMGYFMGVSCMIPSGFNNGLSVAEVKKLAGERSAVTLGFGVTAYLLLMIPFAAVLLLPGFVLGGSRMFHLEIRNRR